MTTGQTTTIMKKTGIIVAFLTAVASCTNSEKEQVTLPFTLDHNRMLVNGMVQRNDSSWRKVRIWVDSGNPDFFLSPQLAKDLNIELPPDSLIPTHGFVDVSPPRALMMGGMRLDIDSVTCYVSLRRGFFFTAPHCDMNLPSTVLKRYDVIFDYPGERMTLGKPGEIAFNGLPVGATIHPGTGIIQMDAMMDGDSLSFAVDNGASYSFGSMELLHTLLENHPRLPVCSGAVGGANIWGTSPLEPASVVIRVPELRWGGMRLTGLGMTIPPDFTPDGKGMMDWYSRKTVRPVDGFLGPNAYGQFCIGIDYRNQLVYLYETGEVDAHDLDMVGLILSPGQDSSWSVIGVAKMDGKPLVEGVETGDKLLEIDGMQTKGKTMGKVIDALHGKPGEPRSLVLERNGKRVDAEVVVRRIL